MNEHKAFPLFTAFSDINEKYISDALDETQHKSKWYLNSAFLGISAACFCLVAVCTAIIIGINNNAINPAARQIYHQIYPTQRFRTNVMIP